MGAKTNLPKVSIIIPAYKAANYLRFAINSALSQTYTNTEVIVVNDGSPDEGATERIARSYGDRIRYIEKKNGGVASALNLAISVMDGELISWLSHDDMYEPDKVAKEVDLYLQQTNPESIIFCGYKVIDETGCLKKEYRIPENMVNNIHCLLALDTQYTLNGCAMLIPKIVFEKYGSFDTRLLYTQDYDLWDRFSSKVPFVYLDDSCMLSRSHGEQGGRVAPLEATLESDNLHERLVKKLTKDEVSDYLDGKLDKLKSYMTIYQNAGYPKTAEAISELYQTITCIAALKMLGVVENCCRNWKTPEEVLESGKPSIVFCNTGWYMGGVERVLTLLLPQLNKKYHMIMVSITETLSNGFQPPEGIQFIAISPNGKRSLEVRLLKLLQLYHVNIFVGHANVNDPFFPAFRLLKANGIRTVMMNHYNYLLPYWINECIAVENKRHPAMAHADLVLWLNSFSSYLAKTDAEHVGVMPNPIILDNQDYEHCERNGVLAVGRFNDLNKRIDRVLEIFSLIIKKEPTATLTIVGSYNWDMRLPAHENVTLREYFDSLDLPRGSVVFEGGQTDVSPYYRKAKLLLMTSVSEGFSMVVCEAAKYGVPSVIYHFPGQEVLLHGKSGYEFEQDNAVEAAEAAVNLLQNDQLWEAMSLAATKHITNYSVERLCAKWSIVFEGLLDNVPVEMIIEQAKIGVIENEELYLEAIQEEKKALRHLSELVSGEQIILKPITRREEKTFENIDSVFEKESLRSKLKRNIKKMIIREKKRGTLDG